MSELHIGIVGGPNIKLKGGGSSIRQYSNGKIITKGESEYSGGKISIGGKLINIGKIKVFEPGLLDVQGDLLNSGKITIDDPEKIKQIIIEAVKAAKSIGEIIKIFIK